MNAKMHVARGGQLTPYGDPHGVLAETKSGLDQVVRERAYLLGSRRVGQMVAPMLLASSAASALLRARLRAWEREGRPEGKADEHWFRTRAFEEN